MNKTTPRVGKGTHTLAFTLLEVILSTAILAIFIIVLVGMSDGTYRIFGNAEGNREIGREARTGLQAITKDLRSAVLTSDPTTLSISEEKQDKQGNNGESLFFLVSQPQEKQGSGNNGDLCVKGYFISTDPHEGTRNLYRFQLSGREAQEAFESGHLKELYHTASPENTKTTELLARHISNLDVRRIPDFPDLLMISLSDTGGEKDNLSDSRQHLNRYTTFVLLPPIREFVSAP